jgi:hypothetical protein
MPDVVLHLRKKTEAQIIIISPTLFRPNFMPYANAA